jgi:hypothetical protein
MSGTSEKAAAALEAAAEELVEFVNACSEADWLKVVPIENRTVAVMAYHIAALMPTLSSWFDVQEEVPGTVAEQDEANAREAEERAAVTREEVMALIRANTPPAATAIRAVTPEWMSSTVRFRPAGGAEMSVERLVATSELHVSKHLAAVRAAIGDPG